MSESPTAIIWCEQAHARFVRDVCDALGARVVAAGTPHGAAEHFAEAEKIDDIRHALLSRDADLALIATARAADGEAAADLLDDPAYLRDARKRIRTIVTTCPSPTSVRLAPSPGESDRMPVRFVPRFNMLDSFSNARDALETFESVRSLSFSSRCAAAHGRLGARLLDAMLTVHTVLGIPESIDATVITPQQTAGIHRATPEALAELSGDLTANLRFSSPRAASITLSDRGGRWFRGASLVGELGCVRIDDDSFEHIDPEGIVVDGSRDEGQSSPSDGPAVRVISRQIAQAMDPRVPPPPQQDLRVVLSMCQAAILSARTGEPESPGTIMRLSSLV